jgi:RNA polymerase sigma factor (sigma-70 family)
MLVTSRRLRTSCKKPLRVAGPLRTLHRLNRTSIAGSIGSEQTWLATTTVSAYDFAMPIPPPAPVDPVERLERRSGDQEVLAALRTLSLRERQAIYLRYFEDQSFADTARIMRSPQVSVRVLVHRALGKLRHRLEPDAVKEVVVL